MFGPRPTPGGGKRRPRTVLDRAYAYALAKNYTGTGDWIDQKGGGRNAAFGAGASTSPLYLGPITGITAYLYTPGLTGNYASAPDAAALDITGSIDLRCRVQFENWVPGSQQSLITKFLTTGNQRSYRLTLESDGTLGLIRSTAGTGATVVTAVSTVVTGIAANTLRWVRGTWNKTDGVVTFYTATVAEPGSGDWTQLGATVASGSTTDTFVGTSLLEVGAANSGAATQATAKFLRAQVLSGIGGSLVFDANFSDLTAYNSDRTTLTATTGQTVTINRSATGRKCVVWERACFLLGTDDYFEIADDPGLDFAATDSFTVAVVLRVYGTVADLAIIAKKTDLTTAAGWCLDKGTGGVAPEFTIADGTNSSVDVCGTLTAGLYTMVSGRRNVAGDTIEGAIGATPSGSPTTDATTATLANSEVVRIGRLSGAGTAQIGAEVVAWAIYRESLSDADLSSLNTLLTAA